MISYFSGSIVDVFNNVEMEKTIIVPVTDLGYIQDASIRSIALNDPEIWANVLTFCSGRHDGLICRYIDNATNTQLIFISCIITTRGVCELNTESYLRVLDSILSSSNRTNIDDLLPTIYLIEPSVSGMSVFNQTIDNIAALSSQYQVGLNYVLPSTIL